jgi:hypothetical protein
MKRQFSNVLFVIALFTSSLFTACSNKDLYNGGDTDTTKDVSSLFDFSTNQTVTLNLDYGMAGLTAGFKVYKENPLNTDGTIKSDITPIYIGYTDSNCKYSGNLTLPADVSQIYVYSSFTNIPYCLPLTIEGGKASYTKPTPTFEEATSRNVTYSGTSINIGNNAESMGGNFYALYNKIYNNPIWFPYNKKATDVYSDVYSQTKLSSTSTLGDLIYRLAYKLDAAKYYRQDNSQYIRDTEHVNTTIASKTQANETVDGAHLDLVFLSASGWNQNAMAYYYYPSNAKNVDAAYIKSLPKYVVFPRTCGHYYYSGTYNSYPNSIIKARLQFFGADYKQSGTDVFPAGYTVGWMLVGDMGYSMKYNADMTTINNNIIKAYNNNQAIYSNKEANTGQTSGCITLYDKASGKVIVGFEDLAYKGKGSDGKVGDNSFNDILFYVDADPVAAIYDPDQPTVPDTPVVLPDETYTAASGTLAFEDVWPKGGDYDMNDVVVEYNTKVTINGTNIKQIVDTYKVVSKSGAAAKKDAFGFVINDNFGGTIASDSPDFTKEDNNQYILFNDARSCIGKTFTVTRTFSEGSYPQTTVYSRNYNPFIAPDYVVGAKSRIEVHLPKASATSWASSDNGGENAYYINKDGKYPFAIDLSGVTDFTQVTESSKIGSASEYPLFNDWVNSKGTDYKDWYLYKNGK